MAISSTSRTIHGPKSDLLLRHHPRRRQHDCQHTTAPSSCAGMLLACRNCGLSPAWTSESGGRAAGLDQSISTLPHFMRRQDLPRSSGPPKPCRVTGSSRVDSRTDATCCTRVAGAGPMSGFMGLKETRLCTGSDRVGYDRCTKTVLQPRHVASIVRQRTFWPKRLFLGTPWLGSRRRSNLTLFWSKPWTYAGGYVLPFLIVIELCNLQLSRQMSMKPSIICRFRGQTLRLPIQRPWWDGEILRSHYVDVQGVRRLSVDSVASISGPAVRWQRPAVLGFRFELYHVLDCIVEFGGVCWEVQGSLLGLTLINITLC